MKRYKLSKNICLTGLQAFCREQVPVKYRTGHFVLSDKTRNRDYLINESIKYFIDKFSATKSRDEVIAEVAADTESSAEQVEKPCTEFIEYLCKKNILLPDDKTELTLPEKPLYKRGDAINQYVVKHVLDNSHSTHIYIATGPINDRSCVIKLLARNQLSDTKAYEEELASLQREYSLLQRAQDVPSVGRSYAFERDGYGNAYIVLEFIKGKPLLRFVEATKGLTRSDYRLLLTNLLKAFAQLHRCGLVHGDVHSSNVLVNRNKAVRIIDLGLSLKKEELADNQLLKYGGVDYYMPPERINASSVKRFVKPPDFYSDVYQIGLLLYAVLYRTLPFNGFTWEELATDIKESEVRFPRRAAAGFIVPQGLKNIIQNCLGKEPEDRYPDASGILEDYVRYAFEEQNTSPSHA